MSWQSVPLAEVCRINPKLTCRLADDELVSFLGMADVSESGSTTPGIDRPFVEVRKGYTSFEDGDVLLAKITPCFQNAKIAQARLARRQGYGSTEFHVLRGTERLDQRYLLHFLRRDRVLIEGERRMTGSGGQRRVPVKFLETLPIPLPPLPEQRRIAAILDHADTLRAKRRRVAALFETLSHALFTELFGDPRINPYGFPSSTIGEVATQVTDGEHQTPQRSATGIPLLSARNVRDGYLDFSVVDHVPEEEYVRISRRCNPVENDILISCSGTIGRVARVPQCGPLALVRSAALVRFRATEIEPTFGEFYLRSKYLQQRMVAAARSSSQANLFQGPIKALPLILPPMNLQTEFKRQHTQHAETAEKLTGSERHLDELFSSLQSHAFQGEL